jgi:hypothetical protein
MAGDYIEIAALAVSAADPTATKKFANVYHFARIAGAGTPIKSQLNTAFQSTIVAPLLLALNEDYQQTFNVVRFIDDALDLPQEFAQAGVGAITGQRLPDFVTASIGLKSAVRSRSARGRKSLGPITESSTTGDELTAGAITLFGAYATALAGGFTDGSGNVWASVVRSSKPPAQYRVNPVVVQVYYVTLVTVISILGILKRRKVRA